MTRVTIIGVGRVGGALALSLPADRYRVERLIVRRPTEDHLSLGLQTEVVESDDFVRHEKIGSDLVFITTQDGEIRAAARHLASRLEARPFVFHTSGSLDSIILSDLAAAGCETGSIHPLVSISRPELGPERFRDAYFCVEGTERAVEFGRKIVEDLGGRPFSVETRFKTLYHAAAVTACGHLVALFDVASEMMSKCGISREDSKEILMPLVASTVENLRTQDAAEALTGTFARADVDTFTRHLGSLNENVSDEILEIYLLLGERSLELAATRGVSGADRSSSGQGSDSEIQAEMVVSQKGDEEILDEKDRKIWCREDYFLDHIQKAGLRRTAQRDLILEIFLSTEEHLTSEDLHNLVHKRDPTVGLTTVYRTLKLLTEAGLAREVGFGDGKTYYEHHYNHEHHDHMICTECGKVIEFFSPGIEDLQDQMASNFGFRPTHHSLRMWGVCAVCQTSELTSHSMPAGAQPRIRVKTAIH